jgi:hypothetical protein
MLPLGRFFGMTSNKENEFASFSYYKNIEKRVYFA